MKWVKDSVTRKSARGISSRISELSSVPLFLIVLMKGISSRAKNALYKKEALLVLKDTIQYKVELFLHVKGPFTEMIKKILKHGLSVVQIVRPYFYVVWKFKSYFWQPR